MTLELNTITAGEAKVTVTEQYLVHNGGQAKVAEDHEFDNSLLDLIIDNGGVRQTLELAVWFRKATRNAKKYEWITVGDLVERAKTLVSGVEIWLPEVRDRKLEYSAAYDWEFKDEIPTFAFSDEATNTVDLLSGNFSVWEGETNQKVLLVWN